MDFWKCLYDTVLGYMYGYTHPWDKKGKKENSIQGVKWRKLQGSSSFNIPGIVQSIRSM